jgi:hypothetical protein
MASYSWKRLFCCSSCYCERSSLTRLMILVTSYNAQYNADINACRCKEMPQKTPESDRQNYATIIQHTSSPRGPNSPITPRTRMPTRPQQRPRLVQRIPPLSPNRNTLTRASPTHRTRTPLPLGRRSRATHTRRRRHTNRRRPPTHPPTDSTPV